VAHAAEVCGLVNDQGVKLKVNTTVTKLNYGEDMKPFIATLMPHRWKVFQMLRIRGQNDGCVQDLSTTTCQFELFKSINQDARLRNGGRPVFECCDDMVDSYLMVSPAGNLMTNTGMTIKMVNFDCLVSENLNMVVDVPKYYERGGVYDW
jgi:radical S-adenosyl methionine domain-containing protein 2